MRDVLALTLLLAAWAPGVAAAQDRATELQNRRQTRNAALSQRGVRLEWDAEGRWLTGLAGAGYEPFGDGGYEYGFGAYDSGYAYGSGYPYGPGGMYGSYGYGVPFGYGGYPGFGSYPPNPYTDWRRLWGRGWTDDTEIPPYHRFQYRFFPETLPDPTEGGYPTPTPWMGVRHGPARTPAPISPRARRSCARVSVATGDGGPQEVLVGLPSLGAETPEALKAVIFDRLRRGGGVVIRSLDGYVFRFPAASAIRDLTITGC